MPVSAAPVPVRMEDVTKRYRAGQGIEHVDLEVFSAEVFAFLGPNGAGKTTTIRVLLDLIRPDAGRVRLFGLDPRRQGVEIRRHLGYLPGDLALYEHLTGRELLTHFAHLRRGPAWSEIAALCDQFDLEVDKPIKALSKGNRQKVGLVQALMGQPPLLILDEPTSGLDPLVQNQVHELIRAAAHDGRTVFLSSHILSEVAQVADRVGIIRHGVILSVERVGDLRRKTLRYVDVRFADGGVPTDLAGLPQVTVVPGHDDHIHLAVTGSLNPLIQVLAAHPVDDLIVREPDLEEVLLSVIGSDTAPVPARGFADVSP
jgi:ABC-2 type transport system ATP-binding protein